MSQYLSQVSFKTLEIDFRDMNANQCLPEMHGNQTSTFKILKYLALEMFNSNGKYMILSKRAKICKTIGVL